MSKGDMPVGYIIAIVLGVIVLILLAYLFFSEGGIFTGTVAEQTCIGKFLSYCNFWSICNYGDCKPGGEDFFTGKGNKECEPFKPKIAPGNPEDECKKRLNQPKSSTSTPTNTLTNTQKCQNKGGTCVASNNVCINEMGGKVDGTCNTGVCCI